ncbi:Ferric reductase-like protein [Sulfitobacter noctilucicola]|uniref:Putative ferric reductase n=1 Tax=Sulfitobacter noctilucicola TaxID=1342301 RepID=A0A7W6MA53_9RHOB|nr:ferric reductase-like transmembrane domain-containing protein [Sulfitobacter noctilucicola]KIN63517.1 Ferric reductase-like protein [Sulfitobacter noctilucicola]MBB4174972.1 putative ferric reductase [Sulfitobacter noctilucicola]
MKQRQVWRGSGVFFWIAAILAVLAPLIAAAFSPLLAFRDPVYIVGGFAGIFGLGLLLIQPLLSGDYLHGITPPRARRVHRWSGTALVAAVIVHVAALWITSPPDMVDALTFTSPTPFSVWGVIAMWTIFATFLLVLTRRRLKLPPNRWRAMHTALAAVIVGGTVAHALLIEGSMESMTKAALCLAVVLVTLKVILDKRVW